MKAHYASLPVVIRRLAAAVVVLAVLTTASTAGDSRAAPLSSLSERALSSALALPSAPALPQVPALPSAPALPPAPALPQTPALPTNPQVPAAPTAPAAPVPPPSSPNEPALPRIEGGGVVRDLAGAVDRDTSSPAGESLRTLGSVDPTTVSRSGAAPALLSSGGSSVTAYALGRAGLTAASLPSRSELAKLPPAQRRELVRRAFDTPLRERRLRQMRATIRRYRGCLRALPYRGRRVLELRAGLLGGDPESRRTIGRQIGASPRAVMKLERSSLRRLIDAGERGLCVAGSAAAVLGGPAQGPDGSGGILPGGSGGGGGVDSLAPAGDVLADADSGGASPLLDLGDGEESPAETLLFFLLALLAVLGPLAAIAIALRRRTDVAGAAPHGSPGERPLLFLDVDGVIVLDPLSDGVPPGRICTSALGLSYVPDRVGTLVRELATRFDIVWATGWEHHANTGLSDPLGLSDQLPVLTFGKKARFGSSKWKIQPVKDYAGNRPAAWLDDNFVARHERWAAHRSAPTLLVPVDSRVGLTPEHVRRLIRWADGVAISRAAKASDDRRLRAG